MVGRGEPRESICPLGTRIEREVVEFGTRIEREVVEFGSHKR
jgi:hypothetical protein